MTGVGNRRGAAIRTGQPRASLIKTMSRKPTLGAGVLLFAISWVLPVHEYGKTLPQELPGWEAFQVALFPNWGTEPAQWYAAALSVASALTNLLPVISLLVWLGRSEILIQLAGWACIVSLGLNAQWFLNVGSELRLGYYLWWLSFGVLGLACLLPANKLSAPYIDPVP